MKSEKIVKKNLEFFFSKLQQIVLDEWNVFRFGQIFKLFNFSRLFAAYHKKIFVPAFFKVPVDHLPIW